MATEAVLGVTSKLGTAVSNPASPPADPTEMYEFLSEDVKLVVTRQNFSGIRGTRSLPGGREAMTNRTVSGSIRMQPTPTELTTWLPRIMGGTPTGTTTVTYPLGETLPAFDVFKLVGPAGGAASYRFNYRGCYANRATFSASQGSPLALAVDVVGTDRDDPPAAGAAATWPGTLTVDEVGTPFMMYQGALTLGGVAYTFKDVTLAVENELDRQRFLNSLTATEFPTFNRQVSLTLHRPWGNSEPLLAALRAGMVAGSLAFTNGTSTLTFTLPYLLCPALADPAVDGKHEVVWPLKLVARGDWDNSAKARIDELSTALHP